MQEGDLLGGRFLAQSLAGMGAMGQVWRALDRETGVAVAVKVLLPGSVDVARFVREADFLARLRHPNVVSYVAHGVEAGRHYLVTEWLEGEDLAERLRRGVLGVEDAFAVIDGVARGLGCVHDQGVVHRDVKPSNIFLEGGDVRRPKMIDFGIARALDRTATIGMVLGTPYYVAPEQAQGNDVDARADVFSLGCVLHECVRGRPPFDGDQLMAVLGKILFQATPLTHIAVVDEILRTMLAKDRQVRPRNGREVSELLARTARPSVRGQMIVDEESAHEQALCAVIGIGEDAPLSLESSAPTMPLGVTDLGTLVSRFGGRQASMMNGSSVVVFDAAGSATDLAERAGRCALAIHAIDPSLRIAVALGRGDTSVASPVGPALDRVASLLAGTGGGVVLDETAAGLMKGMEVLVDGDAARLVGTDVAEAERLVLGKPTAFIGRDRELASLVGLFDACAQDGASRCAVVTAPPGVGKSRLTRELLRVLRSRDRASVWIGTGDPVGAGSALGILSAALRGAIGVVADDTLPDKRQRVRDGVRRWGVSAENEPRVAAFLGEMCGVRFPEEGRPDLTAARRDATLLGDQMRRAFEDLVAAACALGPLALVLEDLHWGDASTIDFVEGALRRCADRPLFVLGLGRPEIGDMFPRLWESRGVETIRLGGLPRRAASELVRTLLPELPPGDVDRVVATADGNAFYLEELVRSIGSGRATAMPETVLAMVEARLARLDQPIRRMLRAASVFGETFSVAGVRAVTRGAVDAELAELALLELIHPIRSERGSVDAYSFRHALVREAAYLGLSDNDRRRVHRAAAVHLEASGDADPAVLAEHFERAGDREDAARLWARAAEVALQSNAHREAMARAERAISLGAAPGAQRGLQAEAASWLGDTALAWEHASAAMTTLPAGTIAWCRALMVAAISAAELGRRDDLLALAPQALAIPVIPAADEARVIAQCRVAVQFSAAAGRLDLLQEIEQQVIATVLPETALLGRAWAQRLHANHGMYRADLQAFQEGSEEALRLFRAAADARSEAWQRVNVGAGLVLLGDFENGVRHLQLATSVAEDLATHGILRYGQEYLANALRRLGRLEEAAELAATVAVEALARGDRSIAGQAHCEVAWSLLAQDRLEESATEARRAAEVLGPLSSHAREPLTILASIALRRGEAEEVLQLMEPVLARAADAYWEGDVIEWVVHAEALLALGRVDEMRRAVAAAHRRLEARAACIRAPERRATFLERIDEHARLRALASVG